LYASDACRSGFNYLHQQLLSKLTYVLFFYNIDVAYRTLSSRWMGQRQKISGLIVRTSSTGRNHDSLNPDAQELSN